MKKNLITVLALLTLFCFVACDSKDEVEYSVYALKTFEEAKDFVKKISDNVPFFSMDDHQLKLLNSSTLNHITFGKDGNFNKELGISVGKSLNDPNLPVYYLSFDFINEEFSGLFVNVKVPPDNPYLQELLLKTGYENNLADFILTAEDMKDFTADDYELMHNLMDSIYNFMYEEYAPYME